jgi:hypothetical protein
MVKRTKVYAVLTGDLVKSSKLSTAQSRRAMDRLKAMAAEFGKVYPGTVVGRMDTFRHDSWQLLIERPDLALRTAVFLRAALKVGSDARTKYDTRISIGVGRAESIVKRRISDSNGPAFTLSGKGLDAMRNECLVFSAEEESPVSRWLSQAVVPLVDSLTADWTPTECVAVLGALRGWTQEETSANWPAEAGERPTRQAVSAALDRAHWNAGEKVLAWIEDEMQTLDFANV